ncbi:hypothetical protein Pmani_029344 [Petrolisthes manimaculis]|uniref:Uncharacterized protein n=1 Tax=Petrolisthes manimaculis TaxID=1843537 RepID=A0AAE1NZJ6_9EUCA|nr:hypothetical protein Pmani_029344 [Petrolisthes manimaculis]
MLKSRSKSRVSYNGQNDELETKTQAIPQARKGRMIKELLSQIPKTSRTNFNQHKSACSSISNSQQTDQTGVIREIERVADLTFNETDFLTSTQLRSQINVRQKRQARDCDASFLEYVSIGPKAGCSVSQSQDGDYNKERGKTKKTKKEKKKVVERKGQTLDSNINGSDKSSENDTVQISLKHKPARETYSSLDSRSCSYRKQCQNELFSYQTHLTQEVPDDVNVLQRDYLGKNYKSQDILRTACNPLNKYGDYPDVEAMNINSEDDVMTCGQRLLEEQQLPTVENTLQRWTDGNNSEADTDTHWAAFPSIPTDTAKETPLCSESEIESEAARSLLNRIIESRGFIVPINENRTGVTMENRSQAIPEAAPRDHHCKRTWKEKEYVVSERYQSKVVSSENVNTVNMSDQGEIIKQEIQTASILDIDPLGTFQGTLTVDKDATMSYRLKDGGEPFVMDRKLVYKKELQHDPAYEIYDDMDVLDELQLKKHDISDIEMDCDNTEYTGTYHATQPTISLNTKRAQIVSCDEESHQSCSVALFSYNETGKSSVASKESGLISLGCGGDVSACTGETYSVSYINATQYPQPVNTTQSSPQPVNTTQSSRQPVNTPQSSLQPVNTPQSSLQPVNTPQSSLQPVNTTQSSPQPVNTTQSSPQPVNTRQSSLQPVNTTQSSPQPVNTIQSSPQPVNTAQSSLQPVNTTQPSPQPVNTTQSSPQPVNTPQSSPQPVITPQSSPQPVNTHLPHSNIKNLTAKMLELSKNEEQEEEVGQKKSLLCSSGLSGQQRKKTPTSPLSGNVEGVENSNESNDNLRSEVSVDSQRENAVMSIRKRPKITDNMIEKHNYLGNDQFVDGPRETVLDMRDEGENHSKGKKSIKMLSCKNSSESEVQVIASNAGRMVKKKNKKKKKMITHTNSSESEVQVIASNAVYKVNKKKKKKMLTHTNFSESEVQVIASNTVYKVNKKKKKKKKMLTHINSRESEVQVIGNNSVCKVSKKKKEKKKQKELDDGVCDSVSHVKTTRKETHDSELECVYQEMRKKTKSKHKKRDKSELKLKKLRTVNGFGDEASCGIGTERKESELSFRRVSKSMSRCDNDDEASCGNGTKDNRSLTNRKTPQPLLHPKTTNLPLHNRENVDEMHRLEEEKESALSKSGKERNKISPSRTENGSSLPSPIQNDVDIIDNLPESYNLLQKRKKGEKHKSTIRKKPCNSFVLSHSSLSEPQAMPHNVVLLNRPRKKKKQKNNLGASSNVGLSENKVKLHSHKNGRIFQENPMEIQKSESNHRDKMKSPGTPSGKELRRAVEYGGAAFPGVSSEKSNLCSVTGNNQTQPSIEDITTCPPQYKRKKLLHKPPTHMFATGDEESVVLRIENEIEDLHKQKECVDSKRKKSLEREAGKKCKKSSAIAKFSSFSDIRGSQLHCNILVKVCKKKKEKKCRKFCDDNSSDSQIQRRKKVRDSEVECVYQDGKRTKKSRHNESHLDTSSSSNKKLKKALEYGGDNVPVYTERSNNSLETDQKMSGSCKKKSTPAVPSLSISSMSELEVISCSAVCSFKNVKKKNVEKGDVDRQFNHQIEVHDHEVECVYPEVKRNKKRLKSPISVENVHKRRKKRKVE